VKNTQFTHTPSTMSLIQIIIFIIILVFVQGGKAKISATVLTGMLNYVDDLFPRSSPNPTYYQSYYDAVGGQCNVPKTYERLVGESYQGRVSTETQIDIVYNSWGEPTSYSESDGSGLFLFIVAVATLIVCCNRRPLTFDEMVRLQYDPIFKYKYMSGNF